jgi:predicted small lipoprotein YifL
MRTCLLIAGAAMSLTACGQSTPGAAPTAAATSGDTAKTQTTRLMGEWEYTMQMKITDVQGLPAAQASQMQNASPPPRVSRECLSKPETQADLDKMFAANSGGCTVTKSAAPAGKIAGTILCSNPNGMNGTGTVSGSVAPSDLSLIIALKSKVPVPTNPDAAASLQMLLTMTGKRVGDCPK